MNTSSFITNKELLKIQNIIANLNNDINYNMLLNQNNQTEGLIYIPKSIDNLEFDKEKLKIDPQEKKIIDLKDIKRDYNISYNLFTKEPNESYNLKKQINDNNLYNNLNNNNDKNKDKNKDKNNKIIKKVTTNDKPIILQNSQNNKTNPMEISTPIRKLNNKLKPNIDNNKCAYKCFYRGKCINAKCICDKGIINIDITYFTNIIRIFRR